MKFYKKSGTKLTSAKKLLEEANIDIKEIEDNFDIDLVDVEKKDKNIKINNHSIKLDNNGYVFITLYNYYNNYLNNLYNEYIDNVNYVNHAKHYDFKELSNYLTKGVKYILGSYILYTDFKEDNISKSLKYQKELVDEFIEEVNKKEDEFVNRLHGALDDLESDYRSANNKAIGREAGWLYGTRSYAGAAAGTFLTKAQLESDQQQAKSSYDSKVFNIKFDRDIFYNVSIRHLFNKVLFNLMGIVIDNIEDIENAINNIYKDHSIDILYKYPYLYMIYSYVIDDIEDINILFDIIDYYNLKQIVSIELLSIIYKKYDYLLNNSVTIDDLLFNEYRLYCLVINKDNNKYLDNILYDYFKKEVDSKYSKTYMGSPSLEVSTTISRKLNNVKSIIDVNTYDSIVKKMNDNIDNAKEYDYLDNIFYDYFPGGSVAAGMVFCACYLIISIINGIEDTFSFTLKLLFFSVLVGFAHYVIQVLIDVLLLKKLKYSFMNENVIKWFNKDSEFKRKVVINVITVAIIPIFTLFIILFSGSSINNRLNLYTDRAWKYKDTYIQFYKEGYLKVFNSNDKTIYKYNCNITLGEVENDKDWYDNHNIAKCNIDDEEVVITARTVVYKKYKEDTHLYLRGDLEWDNSGYSGYELTNSSLDSIIKNRS